MARTISDIQTQVTSVLVDELAIAGYVVDPLTWSATNIMRLLCYVIAFFCNSEETLFDTFTSDVNAYIANMKPHTLQWYANMALAFQYGFSLLTDSDSFDNNGYTDDQIEASKIVSYAAVVEETNTYGRVNLRIKLATTSGDDLAALSTDQLAGVTAYMQRIKDAGVPLNITSGDPDSLRMSWTIYYDPLILNNSGNRLDGTATDVITTAIKNYLLALPFNGTFVLEYVQDAVEAVKGVVIAVPTLAQSKYADFDWADINVMTVPDSGYLRFAADTDLVITYVAQSPIK